MSSPSAPSAAPSLSLSFDRPPALVPPPVLPEPERAARPDPRDERLRALGEMASGVAHDFNNALSPIVGFCELLLTRPDALRDEEAVREYLRLMRTAADDAS